MWRGCKLLFFSNSKVNINISSRLETFLLGQFIWDQRIERGNQTVLEILVVLGGQLKHALDNLGGIKGKKKKKKKKLFCLRLK